MERSCCQAPGALASPRACALGLARSGSSAKVAQAAYRRGLMVRISGPNLILSPPLVITREEVDYMVDALEGAFADVEATL